ncbi:MAG: TRAM domain-containing protein [Anaerolineae bacterium]|nr:TRAM domain-containing protein [Anaerolineae bacterium]
MAVQLVIRLLGMIAFGVLGWQFGIFLAGNSEDALPDVLALALLSSGFGVVITPWLTIRPYRWLRDTLRSMPAEELVSAIIGLITGLILASLLSIPLSLLPSPLREGITLAETFTLCYAGVAVMLMRRRELSRLIRYGRPRPGADEPERETSGNGRDQSVLLDTSAIIDGRIADITRTGFIFGTIVVPRFVLNELQRIADSPDPLRRNRGRRGLDMLSKLQKESVTPVRIVDYEVDGPESVDERLVTLAKQSRWPVITNDINLNRVAQLQGVTVLNINELANAVKTVLLPGETVRVRIIQEGKEPGQGVGYLDDGTMVVVENGRRHLNHTLEVVVTKVLQTAAGRMIFAQLP